MMIENCYIFCFCVNIELTTNLIMELNLIWSQKTLV
nr:MAG TPA: hypothetical protein [Caudoviricetes sp.]